MSNKITYTGIRDFLDVKLKFYASYLLYGQIHREVHFLDYFSQNINLRAHSPNLRGVLYSTSE